MHNKTKYTFPSCKTSKTSINLNFSTNRIGIVDLDLTRFVYIFASRTLAFWPILSIKVENVKFQLD